MQIRAENARGNQPPDARGAAPPNFPDERVGAAAIKSGAASASPDTALLDHARGDCPPSEPERVLAAVDMAASSFLPAIYVMLCDTKS